MPFNIVGKKFKAEINFTGQYAQTKIWSGIINKYSMGVYYYTPDSEDNIIMRKGQFPINSEVFRCMVLLN